MTQQRRDTALGSARTRFVGGLVRKAKELEAGVDDLSSDHSAAKPREDLRKRLHALYASAQVFGLDGLAESIRGGLRIVGTSVAPPPEITPEQVAELHRIVSDVRAEGESAARPVVDERVPPRVPPKGPRPTRRQRKDTLTGILADRRKSSAGFLAAPPLPGAAKRAAEADGAEAGRDEAGRDEAGRDEAGRDEVSAGSASDVGVPDPAREPSSPAGESVEHPGSVPSGAPEPLLDAGVRMTSRPAPGDEGAAASLLAAAVRTPSPDVPNTGSLAFPSLDGRMTSRPAPSEAAKNANLLAAAVRTPPPEPFSHPEEDKETTAGAVSAALPPTRDDGPVPGEAAVPLSDEEGPHRSETPLAFPPPSERPGVWSEKPTSNANAINVLSDPSTLREDPDEDASFGNLGIEDPTQTSPGRRAGSFTVGKSRSGHPAPLSTVLQVLVVDSASGQQAVADALADDLYEVIRADNAESALIAARTSAPDIVIADQELVANTRGDFLMRLRGDPLTDFVPVIFLLKPGTANDLIAVRQDGVDEAVGKPFDPDDLLRTVRRLTGTLGPGSMDQLGDLTPRELADRIADEIRHGLVETLDSGRDIKIPVGDGMEIMAAAWSAISRVRAHVAQRTSGRVHFMDRPSRGGPAVVALVDGGDNDAGVGSVDDVDLTGRTIVVADDDPAVLWFFAGVLREAGAEVLEAEDGKIAFEMIRAHEPDVVVSDILMPELDGFGLCRALKRDPVLAEVPVVLISWKEDFLQRMRELEAGAKGYLRKEAPAARILARIKEVLRPRARIEAALLAGGEVRGRVDGLGMGWLLRAVAKHRPDSTIAARDAWNLFEADLREGQLKALTRTATDGGFARGPRVLPQLLGMTSGRFTVMTSSAPARETFQKPLEEVLDEGTSELGALVDAVRGKGLRLAAEVKVDEDVLAGIKAASPKSVRGVMERIEAGESPAKLLSKQRVAPGLLENVLVDLARRGAIQAVFGPDGEDRVAACKALRDGHEDLGDWIEEQNASDRPFETGEALADPFGFEDGDEGALSDEGSSPSMRAAGSIGPSGTASGRPSAEFAGALERHFETGRPIADPFADEGATFESDSGGPDPEEESGVISVASFSELQERDLTASAPPEPTRELDDVLEQALAAPDDDFRMEPLDGEPIEPNDSDALEDFEDDSKGPPEADETEDGLLEDGEPGTDLRAEVPAGVDEAERHSSIGGLQEPQPAVAGPGRGNWAQLLFITVLAIPIGYIVFPWVISMGKPAPGAEITALEEEQEQAAVVSTPSETAAATPELGLGFGRHVQPMEWDGAPLDPDFGLLKIEAGGIEEGVEVLVEGIPVAWPVLHPLPEGTYEIIVKRGDETLYFYEPILRGQTAVIPAL